MYKSDRITDLKYTPPPKSGYRFVGNSSLMTSEKALADYQKLFPDKELVVEAFTIQTLEIRTTRFIPIRPNGPYM